MNDFDIIAAVVILLLSCLSSDSLLDKSVVLGHLVVGDRANPPYREAAVLDTAFPGSIPIPVLLQLKSTCS